MNANRTEVKMVSVRVRLPRALTLALETAIPDSPFRTTEELLQEAISKGLTVLGESADGHTDLSDQLQSAAALFRLQLSLERGHSGGHRQEWETRCRPN